MVSASPSYSAAGMTSHGAVAGAVDDDRDHQGGGQAEGRRRGHLRGTFSGSCLEAGTIPARQAPDVYSVLAGVIREASRTDRTLRVADPSRVDPHEVGIETRVSLKERGGAR